VIRYLFDPNGRINRAKMWLYTLIAAIVAVAEGAILPPPADSTPVLRALTLTVYWPAEGVAPVAFLATAIDIAMVWVGIAITLKRLHDRGKGRGWLILMWFEPYLAAYFFYYRMGMIVPVREPPGWTHIAAIFLGIFSFWAFLELYVRRGDPGPNRYGPSPIKPRTPAAVPASVGNETSGN
jgi:uncharacterized membrane protein YhaH (DUF805 family)